jgi:hypothetical protein
MNSWVGGECHLPCRIYKHIGMYSVKIIFVIFKRTLHSFNAYFYLFKNTQTLNWLPPYVKVSTKFSILVLVHTHNTLHLAAIVFCILLILLINTPTSVWQADDSINTKSKTIWRNANCFSGTGCARYSIGNVGKTGLLINYENICLQSPVLETNK